MNWSLPARGALVVPRLGLVVAPEFFGRVSLSVGYCAGAGVIVPVLGASGVRFDYAYRGLHLVDGAQKWATSTFSIGLVVFPDRLARRSDD